MTTTPPLPQPSEGLGPLVASSDTQQGPHDVVPMPPSPSQSVLCEKRDLKGRFAHNFENGGKSHRSKAQGNAVPLALVKEYDTSIRSRRSGRRHFNLSSQVEELQRPATAGLQGRHLPPGSRPATTVPQQLLTSVSPSETGASASTHVTADSSSSRTRELSVQDIIRIVKIVHKRLRPEEAEKSNEDAWRAWQGFNEEERAELFQYYSEARSETPRPPSRRHQATVPAPSNALATNLPGPQESRSDLAPQVLQTTSALPPTAHQNVPPPGSYSVQPSVQQQLEVTHPPPVPQPAPNPSQVAHPTTNPQVSAFDKGFVLQPVEGHNAVYNTQRLMQQQAESRGLPPASWMAQPPPPQNMAPQTFAFGDGFPPQPTGEHDGGRPPYLFSPGREVRSLPSYQNRMPPATEAQAFTHRHEATHSGTAYAHSMATGYPSMAPQIHQPQPTAHSNSTPQSAAWAQHTHEHHPQPLHQQPQYYPPPPAPAPPTAPRALPQPPAPQPSHGGQWTQQSFEGRIPAPAGGTQHIMGHPHSGPRAPPSMHVQDGGYRNLVSNGDIQHYTQPLPNAAGFSTGTQGVEPTRGNHLPLPSGGTEYPTRSIHRPIPSHPGPSSLSRLFGSSNSFGFLSRERTASFSTLDDLGSIEGEPMEDVQENALFPFSGTDEFGSQTGTSQARNKGKGRADPPPRPEIHLNERPQRPREEVLSGALNADTTLVVVNHMQKVTDAVNDQTRVQREFMREFRQFREQVEPRQGHDGLGAGSRVPQKRQPVQPQSVQERVANDTSIRSRKRQKRVEEKVHRLRGHRKYSGVDADDEGDDDDDPELDEEEDFIRLKARVRHELASYLEIYDWKTVAHQYPPLTDAEISDYKERKEYIVPTLTNIRVDFCNPWKRFPFNKEARDVIISKYLKRVEGGAYFKRPTPPSMLTREVVGGVLDRHMKYARDLWRKSLNPLTAEKLAELARRACRNSRRRTLHESREVLVIRRGYHKHRLLLKILQPCNMSGDETDYEPQETEDAPRVKVHPPQYRIKTSKWQSLELRNFLSTLDVYYREDWGNTSLRKAMGGSAPRTRIVDDSDTNYEDGVAPIGLWRNCYDEDWLAAQLPHIVRDLEILDEDYDFTFPAPPAPAAMASG